MWARCSQEPDGPNPSATHQHSLAQASLVQDEASIAGHLGERAPREEDAAEMPPDATANATSAADAEPTGGATGAAAQPSALDAFLEGGVNPLAMSRCGVWHVACWHAQHSTVAPLWHTCWSGVHQLPCLRAGCSDLKSAHGMHEQLSALAGCSLVRRLQTIVAVASHLLPNDNSTSR